MKRALLVAAALAAVLCIEVYVLADSAHAHQAQVETVGDPDTGTGGVRRGDPDQPQVLSPWCAGCAAGFWWLCPGCNGLGPKGWALGDWF